MAEARKTPHGLQFAPTKVGVLIDLDMGTKDDFLATLGIGFDDALERGIILRPVELVVKEAIGLPRLEAKNSIDGYLDLVYQGVLCTIGPLITDNSLALAPVINRTEVPAITWTGTDRYYGDFCFNLGNGGLAEEAAMMATWIRRQGFKTVGMMHEISPGGVEYASNFRYYAAREKLDILIEAYTTQIPDDLEAILRKIRGQKPDCLAYLGYGYPTIL
ncbi:MAG TPA: ABC transporter substrate-binding protein, partial [Candidatus Acidoferrales bacterium]|nr:ABC transporter substrate-binding protein [Candidatus Acidoferrales bacterium]